MSDDLLNLRTKISALEDGARAILQINDVDALPCVCFCEDTRHSPACTKLRAAAYQLKRAMEMKPRGAIGGCR